MWPSSSVTMFWSKKQPNFLQRLPKTYPHQFNIKRAIFQNSLKMLLNIWATFAKYLVPKNFKKSPIWSHYRQVKSNQVCESKNEKEVWSVSLLLLLFYSYSKKPKNLRKRTAKKQQKLKICRNSKKFQKVQLTKDFFCAFYAWVLSRGLRERNDRKRLQMDTFLARNLDLLHRQS